MYTSKLYLQGFKSFLHKISIVFGEGITVAVSPNSSRKTKKVDAIHWFLGGEIVSVKLRNVKMEYTIA